MSNEATVHAGTAKPAGDGIASYIDHTLLKPEASEAEVLKVCAEAAEYGFKSVCVNPVWVKTVTTALKGSGVLTCSVVGFPLGATPTDVKSFEARGAVLDGADEVDMVINIAAARAGDKGALADDIAAVAETVHAGGAILKVIIETALLTDEQKVLACQAAVEAGADFLHRVQRRGRHRRRRGPDAQRRGPEHGGQGLRRRTVPGRRSGYDCCRCNTNRRQLRDCHRQG